ncbi:MAG: hypothetical protein ATN35_05170 [Epulopiscium sp. Nele67-Bin004]|nr:MAG: hypothetical protein ATN35_05170 [Epulopiscium sp. Nele67-Bin004]
MPFINEYIDYKLEKLGITMAQLSRGLGYQNIIYKVVSCEVSPEKMLIDNMLHRLGIERVDFEWYISKTEYELYISRKNIITLIKEEKLEQAKTLIEEYDPNNKLNNLHKQFKMYANALIAEKCNELPQNLVDMYKNIILQTVPEFEQVPLKQLLLSQAEVCFIVEYAYHMKSVNHSQAITLYFELLKFFTTTSVSTQIKAIFYPKVILNIAGYLVKQQKEVTLISLCDKAIGYARENFKEFIQISQMLELKIKMMKRVSRGGRELKHAKKWHKTIIEMYQSQDVEMTFDIKYEIYNFEDYYVIGDMIKRRRILLGISQAKLAENICDIKTIYRAEKGQSTPHPKITMQIFKKLGLMGDLCCYRIPFVDGETYELHLQISNYISIGDKEKLYDSIIKLKNSIDMDDTYNIQWIDGYLAYKGKLYDQRDANQWVIYLKHLLSLTVDIKTLLSKPHEVYLTEVEIFLIASMIDSLRESGQVDYMKQIIEMIYQYFEGINFSVVSPMPYIALCNRNINGLQYIDLSLSNQKAISLIKFCVQSNNVYEMCLTTLMVAKNYRKQIEISRPMNDDERKKCIEILNKAYIFAKIIKAQQVIQMVTNEIDTV